MQDRKRQILEAAMRCVARKGYRAASIQEIADELGMAKGSIYFYFKSKEEILLSVFRLHGERLIECLAERPEERSLPPREKLRLQLERQFAYLREHRDFIDMLMKEPLGGLEPSVRSLALNLRSRFFSWLRRNVGDIYGSGAEPYIADGVLLFGGMLGQYMEVVVRGSVRVDDSRLSAFLARRLDDVMQGMLAAGDSPIVGWRDVRDQADLGGEADERMREAQAAMAELKAALTSRPPEDGAAPEREDLLAALDWLEQEMLRPVPNRVAVRALLALLNEAAEVLPSEPLAKLQEIWK
jgi:AcrR family transcriptional regulator